MARKSWCLDRRTFLRGSGVTLGLPFLECMQAGSVSAAEFQRPKRMCTIYFPYGASVPGDDHADRDWGWFPVREGDNFRYTNVMKPLELLRQYVSVIGGLSHPMGRGIGGHDTGDIFLTGASFAGGNFQNTVSFDQVAAAKLGDQTRFPSLVLSSDGGIGLPTRARTLSFTASGQPIPSLNQPQQIFERLFGDERGTQKQTRRRLATEASMLDLLLEESRTMRGKLGTQDQRKYDEYLSSVRDIEKRVQRSEQWLDIPKKTVDPTALNLDATTDAPLEYIRTMYDLLYLAFQTDSTRIATYMLSAMNGNTSNQFSKALGLGSQHELAHDAGKEGGFPRQGQWNQCLIENLAYFLQRMASTNEGDSNMLDNTMVLLGTSNSRTHNNHNYPLVFAGGTNMGIKQGQYLTYDDDGQDVPMSNLLFTMLNQMSVTDEGFSDSTGDLSALC
ncbi:MAG TPA: DUF1552 domain-containing protein [Planctomycetes bacterium]|nr:DUF1552 domain-containing protein [Fuerstiella sp.]HIK94566.1 DUF1552 domain-containing protein [Planctomycetota bacterium]